MTPSQSALGRRGFLTGMFASAAWLAATGGSDSLRATIARAATPGELLDRLSALPPSARMPALFVGHGSPMNAIEDNVYSQTWRELGKALPKPRALLVISAHWLTPGKSMVTAMDKPRTIYDFGGFPEALYAQVYAAPGSPEVAEEAAKTVESVGVGMDREWGLDHGTWSVLLPMFPAADIPVVQFSIDYARPPEYHLQLGRELRALRDHGVMILGSGNLVHNLRRMSRPGHVYDWAVEFDEAMKAHLDARDFDRLARFQELGELATLAHPTYEHFLPVLYTVGAAQEGDDLTYFNAALDMGSMSMRSFVLA